MEQDITALILKTAFEKFGITAVKPFQLLVMQRIIEQESRNYAVRHQIVILPTGTGKSLCFLLPAVLCNGITIIVYPLLALMNDQLAFLKANGIQCACLRGGQTKEQRKAEYEKLDNGCKVVITNPETLSCKSVLQNLQRYSISLFVCDEAHVISLWGETFRPSYLKLGSAVSKLKPMQVLAFTATAGTETIHKIWHCMFPSKPLLVRGDSDRENIYYSSYLAYDRDTALFSILRSCEKPAIVFFRKRSLCLTTCVMMKRLLPDIEHLYYHAGLTRAERESIEKNFLTADNAVLYSTNAYGMGVDKKNLRTVIHYTIPDSAEAYIQEAGRAGRDGKQAWSFVIITGREKPSVLSDIFTQDRCRRSALLQTMGQEKNECTGCDNCTGKIPYSENIQRIEKTVLRAIRLHPLRYNTKTLSNLLCYRGNSQIEYSDFFCAKLSDVDRVLIENTMIKMKGPLLGALKIPGKGYLYFNKPFRRLHQYTRLHSVQQLHRQKQQ